MHTYYYTPNLVKSQEELTKLCYSQLVTPTNQQSHHTTK